MLSGCCTKHWKPWALCGCLMLIAPSVVSTWNGDPQAKLPPVQHLVGSNLTTAATGTAQVGYGNTIIGDATMSGKTYVSLWPDQPRKVILGPSGPSKGSIELPNLVPTGAGPPRSRSA
jgi:hypothetical protein